MAEPPDVSGQEASGQPAGPDDSVAPSIEAAASSTTGLTVPGAETSMAASSAPALGEAAPGTSESVAAAAVGQTPTTSAVPVAGPEATPGKPTAVDAAAAPQTVPVVRPPDPSVPQPKRILVVGDENLLFSTGLQEAFEDVEFTATTVLSRYNLEAYNFDASPAVLKGRVRHMVDPCRLGRHLPHGSFDDILLFLPGLSFSVPKELGSPDRPLFAYRTHLFAFHVIRHSKLMLRGEGHLHLVWPEANRFMTSPCGAAGIEMLSLVQFCGCKPVETVFDMDRVALGKFFPFVLGEVPTECPDWLNGSKIRTFTLDKNPIPVPLSVALFLHPDVGFVTIKDAAPGGPEPPMPGAFVPLRALLIHEANHRKQRLKEIYGPKEGIVQRTETLGLIPEPPEEDTLLSIPMEIFMTSFDDLPHLSTVLKFFVCEDQPQVSIASLDVLDPRLPTRIARPPPPKPSPPNPIAALVNSMAQRQQPAQSQQGLKRERPPVEEWGAMRFFCPLTKICTPSAEKMRLHMQGDLYMRHVATNPEWENSAEKRDLILDLTEEEDRLKRVRNATSGRAEDNNSSNKRKANRNRGGKSRNQGPRR